MRHFAEGVFGAGCVVVFFSSGIEEGADCDSWLSGIVVLTRSMMPMVSFRKVSCATLWFGVRGTCVSGALRTGDLGRGEPFRVAQGEGAFFRFLFLCEGLLLEFSFSNSDKSVMVVTSAAGFWSIAF